MRPSPFSDKLKKREIKIEKTKQEPKKQQAFDQFPKENDNNSLNPPPSSKNLIKIGKSKEKQSEKPPQDTKNDDDSKKVESKGSASFKPNLKRGKKIIITSIHDPPAEVKKQQQPGQQQQQQSYRPTLKPNLFRKGQTVASQRNNNRQQVVIEQQQKTQNNEEDSQEASVNQSMSLAPDFKIKKRHEVNFPIIHEQPMEQTGFGVNNFADIKLETRQINLDTAEVKVSEVKVQKQKARVRELNKLLNLQPDLYEETLNISCVTPYEIYINKIKSGSLINSNDQAFDEKTHASCQTATLQFDDFTNQCPQDFHTDAMNIVQKDQTEAFNQFIHKIAPVLEELIKPSTTVVMPPIFLLALRPEFRKLISCPFPVFVYYSNSLRVGIVVIGEKLYIVENQIETVLSIGSFLVAGCRDGSIYLWGGQNNKRSKLYRKILEQTQTTNFELPECSNQQLDRFSIYRSQNSIVSLLNESNEQFTSLDENCKMIKWKIVRGNNNTSKLEPYASHQFIYMMQRPNLIGYSIKKRNDTYFICSSAGVIVWNGEQIVQKLDTEGFKVVNFALPHRTNFIYTLCEDNSLRIYEEHYANELFKIYLAGYSLADICIPETQYENKKLSITARVYLITKQGSIYSLNLLKNSTEAKPLLNTSDKKQRDVIYRGVNKLPTSFQLVSLWRDLKCTSELKKMDTNMEPTVGNIKNILEENRQLHNWLQSEHALTIVQ